MTLILGRKKGMTQMFREDGTHVGVTVVAAGPCTVTQVRTADRDGYDAVQWGYEDKPEKRVSQPLQGHYKSAGCAPKRVLREERLTAAATASVGDTLTVEAFSEGDVVDVIGTTKGRGFAGTIKRHGFARGPKTHGSMNYRRPGSIGCSAYPSRVMKGKRMSGHYGAERKTIKNLEIVGVDTDRNLLLIKGSVPGHNGAFVQVQSAKTALVK